MQSHSSQEVSFLIAYQSELDVCVTNKNINKNRDDMININSFFRGKYSTRFKNYLCDIYFMDEYV